MNNDPQTLDEAVAMANSLIAEFEREKKTILAAVAKEEAVIASLASRLQRAKLLQARVRSLPR